jgi:type VI secretion system secreted protein VgrG
VQVTYEYDAAGRRTAEVQVHHGKVWRLAHELDAAGSRSSTRVPDTGTVTWQRYGSGHVHGVLLDGNVLASFVRDKLYREVQRVQGAITHTLSYTVAGTLARHQWQEARAQAKTWRSWEYDWIGEVRQIQDAMRGEKRYSYDDLSRLTDAGEEHFTYDATGNLVEAGHEGWYGRATGNRLEVLVLGKQRIQYSYDGHGNRIIRTVGEHTLRHQYDAMHQLEEIALPDGTKARYEYDALGRRIAKHVAYSNGRTETTLYVWDGDWLAQEISNGRVIAYIQHPDHAGPLAKLEDGKVYHYVTDHLGTPQELHNEQGKVVWAAEYSAYGRVRQYLAHEVSNPIRFAGQYLDEETGLHYNRFRYYDPQAGRYASQDPAGLSGGMNTYAYVKGNPVHHTDPLGLVCNDQGCWNTPMERAYAMTGDWKDYYAAACAGGDSYACEGGNVAGNIGVLSEILNTRLGNMIFSHLPAGQTCAASHAIVEKKMGDIRVALAAARVAQLDMAGASPANPVTVSGQSIAEFHNQVFQAIGGSAVSSWGIPVFGGDLPFSNALVHWCAAPACHQ